MDEGLNMNNQEPNNMYLEATKHIDSGGVPHNPQRYQGIIMESFRQLNEVIRSSSGEYLSRLRNFSELEVSRFLEAKSEGEKALKESGELDEQKKRHVSGLEEARREWQ